MMDSTIFGYDIIYYSIIILIWSEMSQENAKHSKEGEQKLLDNH